MKFLFGSKMLKLQNNRDEDWIQFVDKMGKEIVNSEERSIPFYKTTIQHFVIGERFMKDHLYNAGHLYQLSSGFDHGEDYPFNNFNILQHKSIWL